MNDAPEGKLPRPGNPGATDAIPRRQSLAPGVDDAGAPKQAPSIEELVGRIDALGNAVKASEEGVLGRISGEVDAKLTPGLDAIQEQLAKELQKGLAEIKAGTPPPPPSSFSLAQIKVGEKDGRGRHIERILAEAPDRYVVYRAIEGEPSANQRIRRRQASHARIVVHLSDNPATRTEQAENLSEVSDLRAKVGGLINGKWRDPYFERALGEALGMAAEFDVERARTRLTELLDELKVESLRIGQAYQMAFSCGAWVAFVALLYLFSDWLYELKEPSQNVWLAAKGGATGALFSIATMYSRRVLAPDTKKVRIALDATIRIGSGVIASGALLLALSSGFFMKPLGGDTSAFTVSNWMYVVVLGFLAGFVERLVPTLFEQVHLDPSTKGGGGSADGAGAGSSRQPPPPPGGETPSAQATRPQSATTRTQGQQADARIAPPPRESRPPAGTGGQPAAPAAPAPATGAAS